MKPNLHFATNSARMLVAALLLTLGGTAARAQTDAFTYQGRLTDGGATANGTYDLVFKLYDAATDGEYLGAVTRDDVTVTNGVFSASLNFGPGAFNGGPRWLEICVRPGASTGAYTTLTPRQEITSTPYAIRAQSAESVTGVVYANQLVGTLPPGVLPAGGVYVNNSTTLQSNANFNIGGDGVVGGTLSASTVSAFVVKATTQYNLGSQRILGGGGANLFVGLAAGNPSIIGNQNTFVGHATGLNTTTGMANSFFGDNAGVLNTTGTENAFFGDFTGSGNGTGKQNSFFGGGAGGNHGTGDKNTFVGYLSGWSQRNGTNNTLLGAGTDLLSGLSYATAIGAGATVSESNSVVLGRPQDRTLVAGPLDLNTIPGGGSTHLCLVGNRVSTCSSSLRYKANVQPLASGLNAIQRLRPVTFDWKDRDEHDLGFIAEEVAAVEPLLTFRNEKGEIEGVKYAQISAVLVNAVKEQQAQIERQQKQIRQLQQIICASQLGDADFCKTDNRAK